MKFEILFFVFGICALGVEGQISTNVNDVHLILVNQNPAKEIILGRTETLRDLKFKNEQAVFIYIHGFTRNVVSGACIPIRNALFIRGFANILCVEWGKLAGSDSSQNSDGFSWSLIGDYPTAMSNTVIVGNRLGELMVFMVENRAVSGYASFYLVGHSLGAHVAAIAGKYIQNHQRQSIGRITGLDPAGPLYSLVPDDEKIDSSKARYVEILHTDVGLAGTDRFAGHVDYFINGGHDQPGCGSMSNSMSSGNSLTCSHSKANAYFQRLVLGEAPRACECDSNMQLNMGNSICERPNSCNGAHSLTLASTATGHFYVPMPENPPADIAKYYT